MTIQQNFELVVFDCDGVLIDSEIISSSANAEALTKAGYPITTEEVIQLYTGVPDASLYAEVEAKLGRPLPERFDEDIKKLVFQKYRTELHAITGAREVLSSLKTTKCIASSSSPTKLALGLIETALYELTYPHIYSANLVARGKPHPDIFEFAAREMKSAPSNCLVIEDSVAGVTAARAAGMACIGFDGGSHCMNGHAEKLKNSGAFTVIGSLTELLEIAL
ncbi:HAD family hydrolase [Pseudohalocynthiibacter aestuariivivens]|uniref:HAD family hydrolase n=1 Tax=Pseudohalocynthiibacter aestuariivivens TaxID=1591409 RepID=A0ABV5JB33_9RHOB|nr:HAD family hydrolase [Pseudohalocynthiibacter aestuariivivens]MBS9715778.1 HAD family hydrolase [Pseudohalocynthiibacter aestuariivivens]